MEQNHDDGGTVESSLATADSVLQKSKNVVYHGDLVEFLDDYRCEACADGQRKCIMQQHDLSCMLCSDAERLCLFTRTIRMSGLPDEFSWDALISDRWQAKASATSRLSRPQDSALEEPWSILNTEIASLSPTGANPGGQIYAFPSTPKKRTFSQLNGSLSMMSDVTGSGKVRITLPSGSERFQSKEITCPEPTCSLGSTFKGEHELRRHIERDHVTMRRMYICIDISEDKSFLKGCKSCEAEKKYNEDYNAGEHLRRIHFNPKPKVRRGNVPPELKRGGKGGGNGPPMSELRKWMKSVEVDQDGRVITSGALMASRAQSETETLDIDLTSLPNLEESTDSCSKCLLCNKQFFGQDRKSNVRRHVRTSHLRKQSFRCDINGCQAEFARSDNLQRHIKTVHPMMWAQEERSPKPQGEFGENASTTRFPTPSRVVSV